LNVDPLDVMLVSGHEIRMLANDDVDVPLGEIWLQPDIVALCTKLDAMMFEFAEPDDLRAN
jgi:hypothetical protein